MLYFQIGEMQFCIDVNQVVTTVPLVALQPIPEAPDYLEGLMNIHGECVPVLDLVSRLNLSHQRTYSIDASIILCEVSGKRIGLIVDDIDGTGSVEQEDLQLQTFFCGRQSPLAGMVKSERGMAEWLELDAILDVDLSSSSPHLGEDYQQARSALSGKAA